VVELLGPPGAGKSLAVDLLKEVLLGRGYAVLTHADERHRCLERTLAGRFSRAALPAALAGFARPLLYRAACPLELARFLVRCPRLVGAVLRRQLTRRVSLRERLLALNHFFEVAMRRGICSRRLAPGEVLLLHEGFLQRVVNLFSSAGERPDPVLIERYVSLAPRGDLVIAVGAPEPLCVERVRSRGSLPDRLGGDSGAKLEQFIAHAAEALRTALLTFKRAGGRVIEVENSGDRAGLMESLHRLTSPVLPGPEGPGGPAHPPGAAASG
jgi:hypothetical protein